MTRQSVVHVALIIHQFCQPRTSAGIHPRSPYTDPYSRYARRAMRYAASMCERRGYHVAPMANMRCDGAYRTPAHVRAPSLSVAVSVWCTREWRSARGCSIPGRDNIPHARVGAHHVVRSGELVNGSPFRHGYGAPMWLGGCMPTNGKCDGRMHSVTQPNHPSAHHIYFTPDLALFVSPLHLAI